MVRREIRTPQLPEKLVPFFLVRPEWLDRWHEEALDPDLPIVDPHYHLWTMAGNEYLLTDLVADMKQGHNVWAAVAVEGRTGYRTDGPAELRAVGETELLIDQLNRLDPAQVAGLQPCAGIVAHADLRLGAAVEGVLEAHKRAAGNRLRGIRLGASTHPDPSLRLTLSQPPLGLLLDADFRKGFSLLKARDLSFDASVYHPQIPDLVDLAHAFPDTTIILNHMGTPLGVGPYAGRRNEVFSEWRAHLADLATCSNVNVKIGGFGIPGLGLDFSTYLDPPSSEELASAWRPYIETCVEIFGAERCMFESDFPVDKGMFSYGCFWNATKIVSRQYTLDERKALFSGTAARVYRLSRH